MAEYIPQPLAEAAAQFAKLPGVGIKTAGRLAYYILNMPLEDVEEFADTLVKARQSVKTCSICRNFSESEVCSVCSGTIRDKSVICVVESPKDVTAVERAGGFTGVYHVLHGLLSPSDGVGPAQLTVKELMSRLSGDVTEIIMATSPTIEGEATVSYLSRLIKPMGIKVTRLAYGLPVGASLEYADTVTLSKAIENRNVI
ncbi:MAG: recombination mediator RecR [Oscillospiraceae bacterium]|jgi:recombination protein RecR|nr:recombination mediator RecR [Oscillospiraceae bacterium]